MIAAIKKIWLHLFWRWIDVDKLPRKDGFILHPYYGPYPEEVAFEQGMTIMPGQTASAPLITKTED